MDIKKIEQMGMEQGFSHVVLLDCDTIELRPEVRQMCASDTCHKYDKCWSCPPGCGSLEECEAKVRQYKYGIIVQTVGELEDALDGEGMMETEARHKEYFCGILRRNFGRFIRICWRLVRDAVRNVRSVLIRMLHADFRNRLSHRWRLMGCLGNQQAALPGQ